jgi:hypothetical protein
MSLTSEECNEYATLKPKPGSCSSSSSHMMFEERKNWVWWTCMWLPWHLLCRCENLMFWIELFQNFLTDFVLQSSGLNKIVLVVEITGFCNIIMLLLAQWLCLARICMGFESDYVQCNAPCAISSDRTFFLQRLFCVGFESIICIFAVSSIATDPKVLCKICYDGSSWFVVVARLKEW